MIGKCRLCLQEGIELRNSHYIPAGVYRQLREEGRGNANPWAIKQKAAFQTSKQLRAHLLCGGCEKRLSDHGEDWVLRHFLQADGTFRLAEKLRQRQPDVCADGEQTKVYFTTSMPDIDVAALAYFGASVFWRGSIYAWNDDGSIPVPLGKFAEQFRLYLIGEDEFPAHAAIFLAVREGDQVSRLTATPVGRRHEAGFRVYKFPMPGLGYSLAVGRNIPATFRNFCLVRGHGRPIAMTPLIEPLVQQDAVNFLVGHQLARKFRLKKG